MFVKLNRNRVLAWVMLSLMVMSQVLMPMPQKAMASSKSETASNDIVDKTSIELSNFQFEGERVVDWKLNHVREPERLRLKVGEEGQANFTVDVVKEVSKVFNGNVTLRVTGEHDALIDNIRVDLLAGQGWKDVIYSKVLFDDQQDPMVFSKDSPVTYPFQFTIVGSEAEDIPQEVHAIIYFNVINSNRDEVKPYSEQPKDHIIVTEDSNNIEKPNLYGLMNFPRTGLQLQSLRVFEQNLPLEDPLVTINKQIQTPAESYEVVVGFRGLVAGDNYPIEHVATLEGKEPDSKVVLVDVYDEDCSPTVSEFNLTGERRVDWSLDQEGLPESQRIRLGETGQVDFNVKVTRTVTEEAYFKGNATVLLPEGAEATTIKSMVVELTNGEWSYRKILGDMVGKPVTAGENSYEFQFGLEALPVDVLDVQASIFVELACGNNVEKDGPRVELGTENTGLQAQLEIPDGLSLQSLTVDGYAVEGEIWPQTIADNQIEENMTYRVTALLQGERVGDNYPVSQVAILEGNDPDRATVFISVYKPGEVTPPPSDDDTPPVVVITPEKVPAGDPTITLKSHEPLKAAYALLPEGRRLNLKYNAKTGLWKGSFLVPFGTPDGLYPIKIFTINRQGVTRQYNYTITIDNGLPLIIANPTMRDGKVLTVNAQVLFPATEVTAEVAGHVFSLTNKLGTYRWEGVWEVPADVASGTHTVTLYARDAQGNSGTVQFEITVVNRSEIKKVEANASVRTEETEIAVEAEDSDKPGVNYAWGIPALAALGAGFTLLRRKK